MDQVPKCWKLLGKLGLLSYKLLTNVLAVPVTDNHPSMSGMNHMPRRQPCHPNQTKQDSCWKMAARPQSVINEKNRCV